MTLIEIACLLGVVVGLLLVTILVLVLSRVRRKGELNALVRLADMEKASLSDKLADTRHQLQTVSEELKATTDALDKRRDAMAESEARNAALVRSVERIPQLERALEQVGREKDRCNAENLALEKRLSEMTVLLEEERRQDQERITFLQDAKEQMTHAFQVLAQRILDEKGKTFTDQNRIQMDGLITPLREQLAGFKKRVEDVYDKESRDRATLLHEIGNLKNLNERIGKDALNLTQALKGDVKTLGGWGEVILSRILEGSGLQKGRIYETQVSMTNSDGKRLQPDVIIRLPEGKDVVVDSKVSLVAYERFHSATDEKERQTAAKAHLSSVRNHINGLRGKQYEGIDALRTLDFVLMFVPIEGAFFLALEHDRTLFTEAFDKNVVLVSPSTLLVTLRTIQNFWRFADQNENALEIAKQAGALYDKFVGFTEALEDVGRQLDRARQAYHTARDRLATGRGNLIRRAEQLKVLGVKSNKTIPSAYETDGDFEAGEKGTNAVE